MGANVYDLKARVPLITPYALPTSDSIGPPLPDDPEYDVWLDEQYGSLDVGDSTFAASTVLRGLEPVSYGVMYGQYLEERKQEIEAQRQEFGETVEYYFPTPIAYNFHQVMHGFQNANQRLDMLRDVWELLIHVIYALVVGEYRSRNLPMQGADFRRNQVYSDKLADKLEIVEKLLTHGDKAGHDLATARVVPVTVVGRLRDLNRLRNEFAHSVARSEREANADFEQHFGEVLDALQDLAALRDVKLMRWLQSQSDIATFRHEHYSGYATSPTKIASTTIEATQIGVVHPFLNRQNVLAQIDDRLFSVAPFLHFEPVGNSTHLCYFKNKKGEQPAWEMEFQVVDGLRITFSESTFAEAMSKLDTLLPNAQ